MDKKKIDKADVERRMAQSKRGVEDDDFFQSPLGFSNIIKLRAMQRPLQLYNYKSTIGAKLRKGR